MKNSVVAPGLLALVATVSLGATYRADQTPGDSAGVEAGAKVFKDNCARCHGDEGEGKFGWAPRLNDQIFLAAASNDFLKGTFTHGRAGTSMAAFEGNLSDAKRTAVVAYLRSWQTVDGTRLDESALKVDEDLGKKIYDEACAGCHGWQGAGYTAKGATVGIGHKNYLDIATDGYIRAVFGRCANKAELARFAPMPGEEAHETLNPVELDAVISYLRKNSW